MKNSSTPLTVGGLEMLFTITEFGIVAVIECTSTFYFILCKRIRIEFLQAQVNLDLKHQIDRPPPLLYLFTFHEIECVNDEGKCILIIIIIIIKSSFHSFPKILTVFHRCRSFRKCNPSYLDVRFMLWCTILDLNL